MNVKFSKFINGQGIALAKAQPLTTAVEIDELNLYLARHRECLTSMGSDIVDFSARHGYWPPAFVSAE